MQNHPENHVKLFSGGKVGLGLDCDYLVRRRKEALEVLFEGDELLSEDLLRDFKEKVMTRDNDNRLTEFCFVISNVIGQILS